MTKFARGSLIWIASASLLALFFFARADAGQKTDRFWENLMQKYGGESLVCLLDNLEADVEYTGETVRQDISDTERGGLSSDRQASIATESRYTTTRRFTRKYAVLDASGAERVREIVIPYWAGQVISRHSGEIVDREGQKTDLPQENIQVRVAYPDEAEIYQRVRNLVFRFEDLPIPCVINLYYTIEGEEEYGYFDRIFTADVPTYRKELVYNFKMEYAMLPWWQNSIKLLRAENPEEKDLTTARGQMYQWVWGYKNLKPTEAEPFAAPVGDLAPRVQFSPNWESNWPELLSWYAERVEEALQRGGSERVLRGPTRDAIQGSETDKEKIASIFRYVQDHFTPFDLPLGREGFIPNRPVDVMELERIATKDLAVVLLGMLRTAGIDADYGVVATRDFGQVRIEFPALIQFNHAVVVARADGETFVLDPTDRWGGIEDPPSEIEGQIVLPVHEVDPNTGEPDWMQLPISTYNRNSWNATGEIVRDEEGIWRKTVEVTCRGELNRLHRSVFRSIPDPAEEAGYGFRYPLSFRVQAWSEAESLGVDRDLPYQYTFEYVIPPEMIEERGDTLLIPASLFSGVRPTQMFDVKPEARRNPIRLAFQERGKESTLFTIPEGYAVVSIPEDLSWRKPLGRVEIDFQRGLERVECDTEYSISESELAVEVAGQLQEMFDYFRSPPEGNVVLVRLQEEVVER
ncbi:MAG: DUF3857 domain-containing protein [Candidatus Eisenbacteria bacterium]|nr:DUF3857 domain-containing protein [Candidatus Eisenbacteria bacterium]